MGIAIYAKCGNCKKRVVKANTDEWVHEEDGSPLCTSSETK